MFSKLRFLLVGSYLLIVSTAVAQQTITVGTGKSYATIQAGINVATTGDTVLVAPGTYFENINFNGKAITVVSAGGPSQTIIDGGQSAPAVIFSSGETRDALLSGFTVQHGGVLGNATSVNGGIYLQNSSPTIANNILTQNYCFTIYALNSAPLVQENGISATQYPSASCPSGGGAAIYISGNLGGSNVTNNGTTGLIIRNTIEDNVESANLYSTGGGAGVFILRGSPVIMDNIIRNNASPGGSGAAVFMQYGSGVAIVQNLIYGNSAGCGGGAIALTGYPEARTGITALIANNTIVDNTGLSTSGFSNCISTAQIYPGSLQYGISGPSQIFINNIISGSTSYPAVNCDFFGTPGEADQPAFENDIVYNAAGPFFGPHCFDVSGKNNNVVADPQFVNPAKGDYHLLSTSPAIDRGQSAVFQLFENLTGLAFSTDLDAMPRVQNPLGNGCIVDMGAYEYLAKVSTCATNETLVSSFNPSPLSQTVTFTAQVSSMAGVPTGTMQFADNSTPLGTETVSSAGLSTFATGQLTPGSHTITATYVPSGSFAPAVATLVQTVIGDPTSVNLTCNPVSVFQGGNVLLTAAASSSYGTPTGSFIFTDNGANLSQISAVNGAASTTYSAQVTGKHALTATFIPSGEFAGSSATCSVSVLGLPTVSVLSVSPASSTFGSPVTLTATVSPVTLPGPSAPTGNVNFFNGATSLGTAGLSGSGTASVTVSNLPGGFNPLSCLYLGNSIYDPSPCNTVPAVITGASTTLTLTSSLRTAPALTPVTFTLHLASNSATIPANVGIPLTFNGNQTASLYTDATGSASFTTSSLAPGMYLVSGTSAATLTLLPSSASLTEVITANPTSTTLTAAPNPAYQNQLVTLTANVISNSSPAQSGVVTFYDAANTLGTGTVTAGQAVFTSSSLAVGTHAITATYAAGASFNTSTSNTVPEVILAPTFTLALTPSTLTLATGQAGSAMLQFGSVGNFAGPLALTFGTLPTYSTATFSPTTVMLTGGGTATATFSLNTILKAANTQPTQPGSRMGPTIFAATALLLLPLALNRRKRRLLLGFGRGLSLLAFAIFLQSFIGCTNSYYLVHTVASGTYQIPITATDVNHNAQTANLTLTITP